MDRGETERWAERRRPFDRMEAKVVQLHLARPDSDARAVVHALRYAISFARLTAVRNRDGVDVDERDIESWRAENGFVLVNEYSLDAHLAWIVFRAPPP